MKHLLALLFAAVWFASPASAAEPQPNVVVLLGDDQAWTDYGFMGHKTIKTPRLDKLAQSGLVFDRGYVASPLCRPSLASLVTGRFPFEHGITGNDVDGKNNRAELDVPVRERFHKLPSFIRELTAQGYLTHQSGKWWEGSFQDGGFTHGMTHGDPARGARHGDAGLVIGREGLKPVGDFLDLAVAEKKPFLLWYAPFLPHTPHTPPERLLSRHRGPGVAPDVAKYQAMCEWFDETCGELLDLIEKRGQTANTLVVFLCDNGWAAPSTNAADPNQKLWKDFALRSKSSPFENGVRTPIVLSWPGRLKPGRSFDLAHAVDVFPTIAAATGLKAPAGLPGLNLLDEKARQGRDTVFGVANSTANMTPGEADGTLQYRWCVSGEWKLLLRHNGKDTTNYKNLHIWDTQPVRLYNLKNDPQEKNELSAKHPEIVANLRKKIEAWHPVAEGR